MNFTPQDIDALLDSGDEELIRYALALVRDPLQTFEPRPDRPNEHDEQTAFIEDSTSRFACCLGGTGSGKTEAAAFKVARYVLDTPPMRERLPFWIIGDSYDTTCDVCWNEKLSKYIPKSMIAQIDWYKSKRNWPYAVSLKHPTKPGAIGWVLEFKSYEQGLTAMKAKSIGGFWCNEEVPYEIVLEVMGRCRDYNSPGWADFTPIEVKSPEWLDLYEHPPDGWRFYHLNTRLNAALGEGWADWYLDQIPEDMRATREIGTFAVLRGMVFKEFRKSIHVIEPFRIPHDWRKVRGIDFGFNNPFCALWIARDHDDRYYVYDEHYESQQLNAHHASAIYSREWNDDLPWYGPTYTDHDAQERAELGNFGIHCTPASKAINPGIEMLRSLLMIQGDGKPRMYIFDICKNLVREILGYKWREGTGTRNAIDEPMDVNNHALDAWRYGVYSDRLRTSDAIPSSRRILGDHARHGILLNRRN